MDSAKIRQDIISIDINNYKSATQPPHREMVEKQILEELKNGHYKIVQNKPKIISAIGAIKKKDSNKIRIIHDCSRPVGAAVNNFAETEKFSYQTIQDAVDLITPGNYLAKLDLKNAYRSVKIHESNFIATGLKWTFAGDDKHTLMVDTRLPFGASKSPQIFNELSQAVCKIMKIKYNCKLICFLDDFLCISENYSECVDILNKLLKLLRRLGFSINYNKIEGPCTELTFLGIVLNTERCTLELPQPMLCSLKETLCNFRNCVKVTKRTIQSVLGKLNWATQCIYGGRFHMRRLIEKITTLSKPWHRTRVTKDMKADADWWLHYLNVFNGLTPMVECRPAAPVCIDACNSASGAFYNGQCLYTPWSSWPGTASLHINYKEVLSLEPAVKYWAPLWKNKKIFVHTDNQAAAAIINKAMSKNKFVMDSLRRIFWHSAIYNFRLRAVYYPGIFNVIADSISRLAEPGSMTRLNSALKNTCLE